MQIDLITVSAQLINFLILVWLLKRFLFRPVLDVMSRRESLIDEQLKEASTMIAESDAVKLTHLQAIASLDTEKRSILDATTKIAADEKNRMLEEARQESHDRRNAWLDSLEAEKRELGDSFRASIASSSRYVTDALLRRISNRSLNDQMLDSFIDQLAALDAEAKDKFSANPSAQPAAITLVSAMPITSAAQRSLSQAVHEALGCDSTIDYQVDEQLIAGVQLNANGIHLKWNVSDMLEDLDDELSQVMENVGASNH